MSQQLKEEFHTALGYAFFFEVVGLKKDELRGLWRVRDWEDSEL
jgi:hypothetical protein